MKQEKGPFDIIGDVHGCYDELVTLINELGYEQTDGLYKHPAGRKLVFVGDLVDRGPKTPEVLRLVMNHVYADLAFCVPGNHDAKLLKWLNGRDVTIAHGLQESIDQLQRETPAFRNDIKKFIDGLISHYVFDGGNLVVAHAGLREEMHDAAAPVLYGSFACMAKPPVKLMSLAYRVRYNWAAEYKGKAMVVYGHTPVPEPQWLNRTIDIDTGCVFGGKLTALRYPEKELVSVPSSSEYAVSKKAMCILSPVTCFAATASTMMCWILKMWPANILYQPLTDITLPFAKRMP